MPRLPDVFGRPSPDVSPDPRPAVAGISPRPTYGELTPAADGACLRPMKPRSCRLLVATVLLATTLIPTSLAVILYGGDNAANTSDPANGLPFSSAGRFVNSGGGGEFGSLVYLGNNYVLTANHVGVPTHATFNGSTLVAVDNTFVPVQVAPQADLKIVRLAADPGVPAVVLDSRPIANALQPSTIVGFGRGRDPLVPINTNAVTWGGTATIAKRWGTNTIEATQVINTGGTGGPYSYTAFLTVLGNDQGANEAAVVVYDSGSPLFQSVSSSFVLTAIATAVEVGNTSTFGADNLGVNRGDVNFFIPVAPYRTAILGLIPEPGTWAAIAGALALAGVVVRRRHSTAYTSTSATPDAPSTDSTTAE